MGAGTVGGEAQERRRPVEEREVALDVVAADSHLVAVDAVGDHDDLGARAVDAPAILAGLHHLALAARLVLGPDVLDVPLVLAHEIRAGRPDGHEELHLRLPLGRHAGFDVHVVGRGGGKAEGVLDLLFGLGHGALGGEQEGDGQRGEAHAVKSSSEDTVAVPRFITTMPPA